MDVSGLKKKMGFSEGASVLETIDEVVDAQKKKRLCQQLDEFEMEGARKGVPYKGAVEFLNFCEEEGLERALLTRNSQKVTQLVLKKFHLNFLDRIY